MKSVDPTAIELVLSITVISIHELKISFISGLEFGKECFCGDSIKGAQVDDDQCLKYPCSGNETETCGGFHAVEIFKTGFKS